MARVRSDNCPGVPNHAQKNADGDAFDPTPFPKPEMLGVLGVRLAGLVFLRSADPRRFGTRA